MSAQSDVPRGKKSPDPDAFHKSLHDGLAKCGVIRDDSARWLDFVPTQVMHGARKASRIVIEDVRD